MHIESELARISKKLLTPTLTATLLTACRQELEETSQEYIQLDYQAGETRPEQTLNRSPTRGAGGGREALPTVSGAHSPVQLPPGTLLLFPSILWAPPADGSWDAELEQALYDRPHPQDPWVSIEYQSDKQQAEQLLEGLATQVDEEAQPHMESVIVAWETWTELFFFHAFYFGYRSGLYWLEQSSPVQGLSKMMERVILTEYALGITLPQVEQELHRELRMRRQKVQPPENPASQE